jgi:hypothetical protein
VILGYKYGFQINLLQNYNCLLYGHNEFNYRQSNFKLLSDKYLDEQIRKDKRLQKMKEIAVKQNKTVGEIEQELKEQNM